MTFQLSEVAEFNANLTVPFSKYGHLLYVLMNSERKSEKLFSIYDHSINSRSFDHKKNPRLSFHFNIAF